MEELSDYERVRLEHIRRNQEMLIRLGLIDTEHIVKENDNIQNSATSMKIKKKKSNFSRLPITSLRRSSRIKNLAPEYNGDIVDSEDYDLRGRKRRKIVKTDVTDEDEEIARREILETTIAYLKEVRARVKELGGEKGPPETSEGWKAEAIRRWGNRVCAKADWKSYVTSRISDPPPVSPLDLLQEYFCADTWQLLCCVALMSRVSSWDTKHRCVSAFFERYPTPSAFLDEEDMDKNVRPLINSLGLYKERISSLAAITTAFLLPEKSDVFSVDLGENKIKGIGQFGYDSFLVFCKDTPKIKPQDKTLQSFCRWRDQLRSESNKEIET